MALLSLVASQQHECTCLRDACTRWRPKEKRNKSDFYNQTNTQLRTQPDRPQSCLIKTNELVHNWPISNGFNVNVTVTSGAREAKVEQAIG